MKLESVYVILAERKHDLTGLSGSINEAYFKELLRLGFQNVAVSRINRMAT